MGATSSGNHPISGDSAATCARRALARALEKYDAWITGLRRSQMATRAATPVVSIDLEHGGITKIAPLATWSEERVWAYIREHHVPYHPLYDSGYTSIGCAPCTPSTQPGEDARAGRWWWEQGEVMECGLHWKSDQPMNEEAASAWGTTRSFIDLAGQPCVVLGGASRPRKHAALLEGRVAVSSHLGPRVEALIAGVRSRRTVLLPTGRSGGRAVGDRRQRG